MTSTPPSGPPGRGKAATQTPFPTDIMEDLGKVEEILRALVRLDDYPQSSVLLKHVLLNSGKRMRPALTLMAGALHNYKTDALATLASGVELLHTATLLHDDTVDKSVLRRGRPTVNSLWGPSQAVLLGDYLFSKSADLIASLNNIRLTRLFADTLMTISMAELEQTLSDFNLKKKRDTYFRWITGKTASVFAMATECAAVLSEAPEADLVSLRTYGLHLGLAFQIVDDILDFSGEEEEMGKPVGSDLMQGALTLPVILLLEREPGNELVRAAYEGRSGGTSLEPVLDRVVNSTILQECYRIAGDHCDTARNALAALPPKPVRQALHDLVSFVACRKR